MKKQTGPVNYVVEISDQQTTKVHHVKKWLHHREPERAYVHVVTDEQEELTYAQLEQARFGEHYIRRAVD